jgi:hypothetical protein
LFDNQNFLSFSTKACVFVLYINLNASTETAFIAESYTEPGRADHAGGGFPGRGLKLEGLVSSDPGDAIVLFFSPLEPLPRNPAGFSWLEKRVLFRDQQTQTSAHKTTRFPSSVYTRFVGYLAGNERERRI